MMNEHRETPTRYEILIAGHLDRHWQAWFEDLTVTSTAEGCTILSGVVRDQADLHGILRKVNNLGLTLISINPQGQDAGAEISPSAGDGA
jgi:hypothetical protein